ncbi:MAG: carbohydrate kinase family protein, partial [Primorskyibacter sp.]
MPTLGTEVFSDDFGAHAGGGAFITAAHMAQIGHPSYLGAMLPVSPYRDLIQPDLEASNVDLSLCNTLTQQDGPQITVAMVQDADRSFLTRRAGPAFPPITAQDIANRTIRHVHIGEVASLIEAPDILKAALAQSVTVSADCGWDDDFDFAALQPFIGMIDVFLPNESEMQTLQGCGFATSLAKVTVIKRGGQGATLVTADGSVSVPAIPTRVRPRRH